MNQVNVMMRLLEEIGEPLEIVVFRTVLSRVNDESFETEYAKTHFKSLFELVKSVQFVGYPVSISEHPGLTEIVISQMKWFYFRHVENEFSLNIAKTTEESKQPKLRYLNFAWNLNIVPNVWKIGFLILNLSSFQADIVNAVNTPVNEIMIADDLFKFLLNPIDDDQEEYKLKEEFSHSVK